MNQEIRMKKRQLNKKQITIQEWWQFIDDKDRTECTEVFYHFLKVEKRLRSYKDSPHFRFKIRKYCNFHGYTDIEPYEVVRIVSPTCVEVRLMDAEITTMPQVFIPGGFSAHCADNHAQEWECKSNPANKVKKIFLGKKGWGGGSFRMADEPHKFYDYNF